MIDRNIAISYQSSGESFFCPGISSMVFATGCVDVITKRGRCQRLRPFGRGPVRMLDQRWRGRSLWARGLI